MKTFSSHLKRLDAELLHEYTIASSTSISFLGNIPGGVSLAENIRLATTIEPDLLRSIPGYLLVSVLKAKPKAEGCIAEVSRPADRAASALASRSDAESFIPRTLIDAGYNTVVCYSSIDWEFLVQRPQHMMRELRNLGFRIIWLNPTMAVLNTPSLPETPEQAISLVRDNLAKLVKQVEPGIFVVKLVKSVKDAKGSSVDVLNQCLDSILNLFSLSKHLAWILLPSWVPVLEAGGRKSIKVFDCVDEFEGFGVSQQVLDWEKVLLKTCDAVFVTSSTLVKSKAPCSSSVYHLPNGVNRSLFQKPCPEPGDLKDIPRPIIGYVGAIAHWVDLALMRNLAQNRPDWSFVLVGPAFVDTSQLNLPNIHLLGTKPYEEVPGYCQHFDCGIIPFRLDDLASYNSNPIKALEYMAAGLPVVSTPIPDMVAMSPAVSIADVSHFERAVQDALTAKAASAGILSLAKKEALLERLSWTGLAGTACAVIASKFAASQGDLARAERILSATLGKSLDKSSIHSDVRRLKRLTLASENSVEASPLPISGRLPYCMLMLPDWSNPKGPWTSVFRSLLKAFGSNDRITLAVRANPREISTEEAVRILTDMVQTALGAETLFSQNMTLINDPEDESSEEFLDRLLLAVDSVVAGETEYSGRLLPLVERTRRLGVQLAVVKEGGGFELL